MNVEVEILASDTGKRSIRVLSGEAPILIGRGCDCSLSVEHELVSRKHAVVRVSKDLLRVEDTSRNGTLAGGVVLRKTTAEIPWGAPIGIGPYQLTFRRSTQGEPENTLLSERVSSATSETPITLEVPLTEPPASTLEQSLRPIQEFLDDPSVTEVLIRSGSSDSFDSERLVELGSLSRFALDTLRALIAARQNLIIAGAAGSGKTTLLRALTQHVPGTERVGVIEHVKEVRLQHPHAFYLEARSADARELFRASLRLRPDRLVIGEIRGAEALDIVEALVSGRGGCLSTLSATSPRDVLTRLETMALCIDPELSLLGLRLQIAFGVNFILQTARMSDGSRKVTHLTEVLGYDVAASRYRLQDIFIRTYSGADSAGRMRSELVPTALPSLESP